MSWRVKAGAFSAGTTVLAGTDVYQIDAAGWTLPVKPAVPAALLHLIARVQAAR